MRTSRVIQIISLRKSSEIKEYLLSTTYIFTDGQSETVTKLLTVKDFKDHLNTGNWHTMTASNVISNKVEPVAVQIVDSYSLRVKWEKNSESVLVIGEEEYTGILKKG